MHFFHTPKVRAFTLIEMLVSMTIAGIVFASVMTSYASLTRARQRIELFRGLQQQGSFALIRITDKVRDYGIDYDAYASGWPYSGSTIETQVLYLGDGTVFELDSDGIFRMNGELLLASSVEVVPDTFSFIITPDADPSVLVHPSYYTLNDPSASSSDYLTEQVQPKVQVQMDLRSTMNEAVILPLETTLSTRIYN